MSGVLQLKLLKSRVRAWRRRVRVGIANTLFAYDASDLVNALRVLGIQSDDAVMLHAAFEQHHGFRGSISGVIDAFLQAVGPTGHLLMPSMPYHSSALDYLSNLKSFDVRRVPSAMGLISEFFRRRPGVLRSVNPSHPILAIGPRATEFIEGHERCAYACGPGSPFDKLLAAGGKVAFFNVSFEYFTFFHYLEHRVAAHLPWSLYHEPAFTIPTIDAQGRQLTVTTFAYSRETLRRRRFQVLEAELRRRGLIKQTRVGATRLLLVELRDVVQAVDEMTRQNRFFYDMRTRSEEVKT